MPRWQGLFSGDSQGFLNLQVYVILLETVSADESVNLKMPKKEGFFI